MDSRHANVEVSWMKYHIYRENSVLEYKQSMASPPSSSSSSNPSTSISSSGTKISPAVLIIIVILSVLFFISGLLHLLIRFLTKHKNSSNSSHSDQNPNNTTTSDSLQRQLQQLFNLHDSGLDQTFIDTLPVFVYKEVLGANDSFDCAVCLCEFSETDKLRFLPICSHAFHINCIDTWLLSNSTCPLCRNTLFDPGFSMDNPIFDFDDREVDESGLSTGLKTSEPEKTGPEKGGFSVRLGKFRKLTDGEGDIGVENETSSSNLDARRCYSMGSYEYVVGDTNLRLPLTRQRDFEGVKFVKRIGDSMLDEDIEGKRISFGAKRDSFSVSKIWLWSKKRKFASSSKNRMRNPSSVDMELPRIG